MTHPPLQGREIIANLSKAAGLASMIAAMRPDIDNIDEYVRNTTARAFSVVASALGIPALLPFLKAVCMSKKSWQVGRREAFRTPKGATGLTDLVR
jgi:splicing factor 3B subunit 1